MTTLYGIANCDTVKKAKKWLNDKGIDYTFHDFRKDGLEENQLAEWVDALGWEVLLNKRGTTWRKLDDSDKENIDADKAKRLLLEHVAMIKRPVLSHDGKLHVGFKEADYQAIFS